MANQELSSTESANVWKMEKPSLQRNQGNSELLY